MPAEWVQEIPGAGESSKFHDNR